MVEPAEFNVELVTPADGVVVVATSGELDLYTSAEFHVALTGAMDGSIARVIVDLSRVTYMDSSALGVLVSAARGSTQRPTRLAIVCPPGSVATTLAMSGLPSVFTVYDTRDQALAGEADSTAR